MKNTKKYAKRNAKPPTTLTKKEETFCDMIAVGLPPQKAYLASGYSSGAVTSRPYKLLGKEEIQKRIQGLIDRVIFHIVKNDIRLAKLRIDKGEGSTIPASLIEGAKNRLYERSSLGPVIKKMNQTFTRVTFTEVDLSRYRNDAPFPPIEEAVELEPEDHEETGEGDGRAR